jgi:hypothetical protein
MNTHKLTLGVREHAVPATVAFLSDSAAAAGLRAKVIVSGTGGWQYIDIVSSGAGKLESLEYVRASLGFGRAQTVAAGDSGNDVAMLAGRHRAIVVGNAQPDLVAWAAKQCDGGGGGDVCATAESAPVTQHAPPLRLGGGGGDVVDVEAVAVLAVVDAPAEPPATPADVAAAAQAGGDGGDAAAAAPAVLEAAAPAAAPAAPPPLAPAAAAAAAPAPAAAAAAAAEAEEEALEGARLYRASASLAWGVIEGLQHFGFA